MKMLKLYAVLFISLSCIYGTCSKSDDTAPDNNGGSDNYVEPTLSAGDSWIYMTSGSLPSFYGTENNRPVLRKWISSKTLSVVCGRNLAGDTTKNYLVFTFENTDKYTRFCTDKVNPGGREYLSIALNKFNRVNVPGTYNIDIDYKEGSCWYEVYKASGAKLDSTRTPGISKSTFTVSKMDVVTTSVDGKYSICKMSGTADLSIMYWKSGTASTTDVQNLQVTFNNVQFTKEN